VNQAKFTASILVLTEDASGDGLPAVRAIARHLLRLVEPACEPRRIDLEPQDERAQQAMHGNLWQGKTGPGRQKLVDIAQAIATKILTPTGFVFLHVDADRRWAAREKSPSDNVRRVRDLLLLRVEQHVTAWLTKKQREHEKAAVMSRVCLLVPYHSIESWLYQNGAVARALCHKHHGGRDADVFTRWEQDRSLLDEVERPKKQTCLEAKHNRALADRT
jgi:hypothetical protein